MLNISDSPISGFNTGKFEALVISYGYLLWIKALSSV